jgi:EcsC protein family
MVAVGANSGGNETNDDESGIIQATLDWIIEAGVSGLGVFPSAEKVAADHLKGTNSVEDAVNSVIAWSTAYAAGTGFVTGLGGIATLPITLPVGIAASYATAANAAAAIACIRGYDLRSEQVKTLILLSLLGKGAAEELKKVGVQVGTKVAQNLIKQIPGKVLIEINKKVGFRLVTKAGEKGVVNLMKCVPVLGGVIGGAFDGVSVNACGQAAKTFFPTIESKTL